MRKILCIMSVLIMWSSITFAQDDSARTVSVVGSATTKVSPDNISWFLTINVRDKEQAKLRIRADEIKAQIMAAVDSLGVNQSDVLFNKVSIQMHYKRKKHRVTDKLYCYELSQRITISQKDVERYDDFWSKLTSIENIKVTQNFSTSQLEPTRRQLRIDALHSAKEKADDLATALGCSVGEALTISEFKTNQSRQQIESISRYERTSVSSRKPEMIQVTAKVYVVFELL